MHNATVTLTFIKPVVTLICVITFFIDLFFTFCELISVDKSE